MQGRNHSSQVGETTLTYSGFTEKFWGDQYIDGPMDQKFRGPVPPVPMVVAPMDTWALPMQSLTVWAQPPLGTGSGRASHLRSSPSR
jgi:hypothetical protein